MGNKKDKKAAAVKRKQSGAAAAEDPAQHDAGAAAEELHAMQLQNVEGPMNSATIHAALIAYGNAEIASGPLLLPFLSPTAAAVRCAVTTEFAGNFSEAAAAQLSILGVGVVEWREETSACGCTLELRGCSSRVLLAMQYEEREQGGQLAAGEYQVCPLCRVVSFDAHVTCGLASHCRYGSTAEDRGANQLLKRGWY
jgi:hypothetical protein